MILSEKKGMHSMFAWIGGPETLVVAGIIVVLFGAKRLPELMKSVGEGITEFRKSTRGLTEDDTSSSAKDNKS